jgi:hypothetical protein
MTRRRWPAVAATVLALVGSTAAEGHAKCAPARYRFEVRVVSAADGRPVPGATVALFVNDHPDELPPWRGSPEDASTWLDGRFQADYAFGTYSGPDLFGGDRCNARVRTVEVVVSRPGFQARRVQVRGRALALRRDADASRYEAALPAVALAPASR